MEPGIWCGGIKFVCKSYKKQKFIPAVNVRGVKISVKRKLVRGAGDAVLAQNWLAWVGKVL